MRDPVSLLIEGEGIARPIAMHCWNPCANESRGTKRHRWEPNSTPRLVWGPSAAYLANVQP